MNLEVGHYHDYVPVSVFRDLITATGFPSDLDEFASIVAERNQDRYRTAKIDDELAFDANTSIQAVLVLVEFCRTK